MWPGRQLLGALTDHAPQLQAAADGDRNLGVCYAAAGHRLFQEKCGRRGCDVQHLQRSGRALLHPGRGGFARGQARRLLLRDFRWHLCLLCRRSGRGGTDSGHILRGAVPARHPDRAGAGVDTGQERTVYGAYADSGLLPRLHERPDPGHGRDVVGGEQEDPARQADSRGRLGNRFLRVRDIRAAWKVREPVCIEGHVQRAHRPRRIEECGREREDVPAAARQRLRGAVVGHVPGRAAHLPAAGAVLRRRALRRLPGRRHGLLGLRGACTVLHCLRGPRLGAHAQPESNLAGLEARELFAGLEWVREAHRYGHCQSLRGQDVHRLWDDGLLCAGDVETDRSQSSSGLVGTRRHGLHDDGWPSTL
mmetsp:Transcript_89546/g.227776  ORF Transcript_89546/g.227776 Transcript_89546/m.227776 type:complete len:364 (+) Transcript_89546:985-2076(+)